MASEKHEPQAKEKKDHKLEIRDLKPKKDPTGGRQTPTSNEKRSPGTTAEIDFMGWE